MYNCKSRYIQAIYKCCLRLDYLKEKKKKNQKKKNQKQSKSQKNKKKIKIALSLGYPSSCFYNKGRNMLL